MSLHKEVELQMFVRYAAQSVWVAYDLIVVFFIFYK